MHCFADELALIKVTDVDGHVGFTLEDGTPPAMQHMHYTIGVFVYFDSEYAKYAARAWLRVRCVSSSN